MEKEITNLKVNMGKIQENLKWIRESQEEMKQTMEDFIETSPKKFASKLSEKIVYTMVGIILTFVLTALLYLIIK